MRTTLLIGLFVSLLGLPRMADACSCVAPPPATVAAQRAAVVFEGTAIAAIASDDGMTNHVGLRVLRRWKGPPDEQLGVETASTPAACGFPFESGKTYLVYAERMNERLVVSLCSRTRAIEDAGDDITALGSPLEAPEGDPVAVRPAPDFLDRRPPTRQEQEERAAGGISGEVQGSVRGTGGGCACTSGAKAECSTTLLLPLWLVGRRRKRPGR